MLDFIRDTWPTPRAFLADLRDGLIFAAAMLVALYGVLLWGYA